MYKDIINALVEKNETISIMDASTCGYITSLMAENVGYQKVLKFSCNPIYDEYKIRFGVKENSIALYTTSSLEIAKEMVIGMASFTRSDYAVSIVGDLVNKESTDATKETNVIYMAFFKRKSNQVFVTTLNIQSEVLEYKKKDVAVYVKDTLSKLILNI